MHRDLGGLGLPQRSPVSLLIRVFFSDDVCVAVHHQVLPAVLFLSSLLLLLLLGLCLPILRVRRQLTTCYQKTLVFYVLVILRSYLTPILGHWQKKREGEEEGEGGG